MPTRPTTTLTVRLPAETKAKLDQLAEMTRRSKSFLAARALEQYANAQLGVYERLLDEQKGADPARREEAVDEVFAVMERASRRQS